jgi:hypothetical protein
LGQRGQQDFQVVAVAWKTDRAAALYGIGMSWNYMVATVMRDAAVVPYVFGSELPGIAMIGLRQKTASTDDYFTDGLQRSRSPKLPNVKGSGSGR